MGKTYFKINVKPGVSFWNILYVPLQNLILFMVVENYVVLVQPLLKDSKYYNMTPELAT